MRTKKFCVCFCLVDGLQYTSKSGKAETDESIFLMKLIKLQKNFFDVSIQMTHA